MRTSVWRSAFSGILVCAWMVVVFGVLPTQARAVTQADIEMQLQVAQESYVATLTEVVKLLQIQLIDRLEEEVARLRAHVEAREF